MLSFNFIERCVVYIRRQLREIFPSQVHWSQGDPDDWVVLRVLRSQDGKNNCFLSGTYVVFTKSFWCVFARRGQNLWKIKSTRIMSNGVGNHFKTPVCGLTAVQPFFLFTKPTSRGTDSVVPNGHWSCVHSTNICRMTGPYSRGYNFLEGTKK